MLRPDELKEFDPTEPKRLARPLLLRRAAIGLAAPTGVSCTGQTPGPATTIPTMIAAHLMPGAPTHARAIVTQAAFFWQQHRLSQASDS
jgi:hypothetical protein